MNKLNEPFALPFDEPDLSPALHVFESCESTLTTAATLALAGDLPEWHSVLTMTQTGGRGQLGRHWVSPPGNLYATLRLPKASPFDGTAAAPAVSGFLSAALTHLNIQTLVKWPNDVVLCCEPTDTARLRKVGGILVEERHDVVLVGVGLNIGFAPADNQLRAQAALPAGTLPVYLLQAAGIRSLCGLWSTLAASLHEAWQSDQLHAWRTALETHLAFRGEMVRVLDDGEEIRGRLLGVSEQGGLRLRTPDGEIVIYSGSLQVPGEHLN